MMFKLWFKSKLIALFKFFIHRMARKCFQKKRLLNSRTRSYSLHPPMIPILPIIPLWKSLERGGTKDLTIPSSWMGIVWERLCGINRGLFPEIWIIGMNNNDLVSFPSVLVFKQTVHSLSSFYSRCLKK